MKHLPYFATTLLALLVLSSCGGGSSSSNKSSAPSSNSSGSSNSASKTSDPSSSSSESSVSSQQSHHSSESAVSSNPSSSSKDSSTSEESHSSQSASETSQSSQPAAKKSPYGESDISKQVYLNSIGDIFSVWDSYRGSDITVAVIDSGFDVDHPEFVKEDGTSKITDTSAFFSYDGTKVTTTKGRDNLKIVDSDPHGTFCAGVVAGSINGTGIVGIAPDCDLMLLKVDKKPKSICEAFKYAADNGAKVVTISIGSYSNYWGDLVDDKSDLTTVFDEALDYAHEKGVVICSAAGNGGEDGDPTEYTFPGASKHVIGAGGLAYNEDDTIWSGSSYNSSPEYMFCDIFAPAQGMYGATNIGGKSSYQGNWKGTSFASPIIAGAAALYFEKNPTATPDDFEKDLYATAVPMSDTQHTGHGRIDIGSLLRVNQSIERTINLSTPTWWNADGAHTYAYFWNSRTGSELRSWPGIDYQYGYSLNQSNYDTVIFTRRSADGSEDWNARTINLSVSLLGHISQYSLPNTPVWYSDSGPIVGTINK